jgi:hypothetical protein
VETVKEVGEIEKGVFDFYIKLNQKDDFFELHFISGDFSESESPDVLATGATFSGSNGMIFDNSGAFFGGYSKLEPIQLRIEKKNEDYYSYYFNEILISNERNFSNYGLNGVKFLSNDGNSASVKITK